MNADGKAETVIHAPTPVAPAQYNALVAAARLHEIRLVKSEFNLNPEGLEHQDDWKLSQTCEVQHVEFDANSGLLITGIGAEAVCKRKSKKAVTFRCRYIVVYEIHGTPEGAAVDAFAKRVARFTAYPYFRAHVAELSSQAGLQLPPLPVIKETRLIPPDKVPVAPSGPLIERGNEQERV